VAEAAGGSFQQPLGRRVEIKRGALHTYTYMPLYMYRQR
jgi:hypothetical protein